MSSPMEHSSDHLNKPRVPLVSVPDIVIFGFKAAFKFLAPISMMILPATALYSFVSAYYFHLTMLMEKGNPGLSEIMALVFSFLLMLGIGLFMFYLYYSIIRYIRDVYRDEENPEVFSYLRPQKSVLGCLGICLFWVATFPFAILLGLVGLLLLLVPGVVFMTWYSFWFYMVFAVYLDEPEQGVVNAIRECWELSKRHFWRIVGTGILTSLFYMILIIGFFLCMLVLIVPAILFGFTPSSMHSALFGIIQGLMTGVNSWFTMAVGHSAMFFVVYRLYYDLRSRTDQISDNA